MKKNISSEEITREIKEWIASFTKDEWRKKLEEEKYLYESNKVKNFEWLDNKVSSTIISDLPIECEATTNKDERRFTWTFSKMLINDKITFIPIYYVNVEVFLEAA